MEKRIPNCGECIHWHNFEIKEREEDRIGSCHRYPPVRMKAIEDKEESHEWEWMFPVTNESHWCGEYKRDKTGKINPYVPPEYKDEE